MSRIRWILLAAVPILVACTATSNSAILPDTVFGDGGGGGGLAPSAPLVGIAPIDAGVPSVQPSFEAPAIAGSVTTESSAAPLPSPNPVPTIGTIFP